MFTPLNRYAGEPGTTRLILTDGTVFDTPGNLLEVVGHSIQSGVMLRLGADADPIEVVVNPAHITSAAYHKTEEQQ